MWAFENSNRGGVLRQYDQLRVHIEKKMENLKDDTYAAGFTWLYIKLGGTAPATYPTSGKADAA